MQKNLPQWTYGVLSVVGVVLVASMFLAWLDLGGDTVSGFRLAWDFENHWLFLVPVAGALLLAAASTRSELTRLAAIAAGVVVSGDVLFQFAKGFFHSGVDTWLILGGAGVILGGISEQRRGWRIAGGLAVLAGFVAPWTSGSMFKLLTGDHAAMLAASGITFRVLWLIPIAAVASIGSGVSPGPNSNKVTAISGIAIYGSFLWVIGSAANLVLGWGAWAAFGASTVALVIGVLAPGGRTAKA